jgi:hypothetical protein
MLKSPFGEAHWRRERCAFGCGAAADPHERNAATIQLVGRAGNQARLLALDGAFQAVTDWHQSEPDLSWGGGESVRVYQWRAGTRSA